MTGIYQIRDIINNKSYIGLSINIEKRWLQHKSALNRNKHCNQKLQNAWNKYGAENFEWNVLEQCEYQDCFNKEIEYIQYFNSFEDGYNSTTGGDKGCSEHWEKPVYVYDLNGCFVTDFRSRAEAERQLQCHSIKECCLGYCNRGFSKTNQKWYQYSYQYADHINPFIFKGKMKQVYQLDINGNILQTFNSGADACRAVGANPKCHNLRDAIQTHKPWHNYYWDYVENHSEDWEPYDELTIMAINSEGEVIGKFRNALDAANQLGLQHSAICKVLKGTRHTTGGLIFKDINYDTSCIRNL